MDATEEIQGKLIRCERPDWELLCDLIGDSLAGWFMWMAEVELDDGTAVHLYKHRETRQYVHLDASGRAFDYRPEHTYTRLAAATAIKRAFTGRGRALLTPSDKAALRAAIARAPAA